MSPTEQLAAQLRAFFAGHAESLDAIARSSEAELLRMIRGAIARQSRARDLGLPLEPQEICQYVYLTLLRLREQSGRPPIQNVLAYLQRLINNTVRERRRRQSARRRGGDRLQPLDLLDQRLIDRRSPTPGPRVDRLELVREVVRNLDPLERRVVTLRVHGWNWRAIGARLDGNPDALRAVYRRAITRLRRWIAAP